MASQKDMRRPDLVVPYVDPPAPKEAELSSTLGSTMPMAAMFMRNRTMAWSSFVFALQNWLAETAEQKKVASSPAYMSVLMSIMALCVSYTPLFMPPPARAKAPVPSASP